MRIEIIKKIVCHIEAKAGSCKKNLFVVYSAFAASWIVLFSLSACNKSELPVVNNNFSLVKVFDDPITNPDNACSYMATGNNRIYMTYGFGENESGIYAYYYKLLTTDNKGVIINVYSFPANIVISDLLVLYDGSVMVSGCDFTQSWAGYNIYLFHLTQNAEFISSNILSANCFQADTNFQGIDWANGMKLTRSLGGNILISGNYYPANFGTNYPGYLIECDVNGNEIWSKLSAVGGFGSGLTVNDGYIFTIYNQLKLLKLNASGDTLWTRSFTNPPGSNFVTMINSKHITQLANGNYLFASSINTSFFDGGLAFSRIFEVSPNGDSVNSVTIAADVNRYVYGIFQQNDGNIFTVLNTEDGGIVGSSQQNSLAITLDPGLQIKSEKYFQTSSTDVILGGSKTSDGKISLFGLIQSYHGGYYKPELLILE